MNARDKIAFESKSPFDKLYDIRNELHAIRDDLEKKAVYHIVWPATQGQHVEQLVTIMGKLGDVLALMYHLERDLYEPAKPSDELLPTAE